MKNRILKMIMLMLASILVIFAITFVAILNYFPSFGQKPSKAEQKTFYQSGNFDDGQFQNQIETSMDMSIRNIFSVMKDYIFGVPRQSPENNLPVIKNTIKPSEKADQLIWFGHSSFFMQLGNQSILIDPMFSQVPAPFSFLGSKRFSNGLPVEIDSLPAIDVLLLSHDHYDHLDYQTIQALKSKVEKFIVPLGVDSHLEYWGVDTSKIEIMNWWDETYAGNITFIATPARHFSGRALTDRNKTLWTSWVIKSGKNNIFFSGDSGYGPHFKEIGEKYGPFNFAMMECGQYDQRWSQIHMMPEETATAAKDIIAKSFMPIHWGSFVLALHEWDDPIKRVSVKAEELGLNMITPQIGETVYLNSPTNFNKWWENLN